VSGNILTIVLALHMDIAERVMKTDRSINFHIPDSELFSLEEMPSQFSMSLNLSMDHLGVLESMALAVPVLGSPITASVEALKEINQYTKVSQFDHCKSRRIRS
jgi:hypothetical protein